jgi:hypothetical protein
MHLFAPSENLGDTINGDRGCGVIYTREQENWTWQVLRKNIIANMEWFKLFKFL